MPCHKDKDFSKITLSNAIHSAKAAETTPAPAATAAAKTPGFELLFAISAILVVILARRR